MNMKVKAALLAAAVMLASSAGAADGKFLADRHVERGQNCQACHADDMKVKTSGDFEVCVDCHGDYSAMIKRTDGRFEVNPHAQHEGALPCSECHKGHKPGVNYCGGCHNFEYKVP